MTDIATTASPARSIVFIDSRVQDAATLLQGLDPGTEVVFLQAGQDGLAQMAAHLQGRTGLDAIHVISHGAQGRVQLGNLMLDQAALDAQQATLATIGDSLSAGGDILLYGCDVGRGESGARLLASLAQATGADVAGSNDLTGSSAAGGNAVLEVIIGTVSAKAAVHAQAWEEFGTVLAQSFSPGALPLSDSGTTNFSFVQVGDFDSDGDIDILTQEGGVATAVTLWRNDGAGSFSSSQAIPAGVTGLNISFSSVRVADYDNDGDLDYYQRITGAGNDLYYGNNDAPPTLTSFTPPANGTANANDNLVLTFSHSTTLSKGTGTISIRIDNGDGNYGNDTVFEAFVASDARVSLSGNATASTVSINPNGSFDPGTSYYVVIEPDAFVDSDGKGFVTRVGDRFHAGLPDPALTRAGNSLDPLADRTVMSFIFANSAPALTNLNGDSVAWAGVGNTVTLDVSSNTVLADTELGALNSGNGDWSGASLTVQRAGSAVSADVLGFNTSGSLFTVSGANLQMAGLTFATYTYTGGVLNISFTSSDTAATTALVNDVARHITYGNDTPTGDAALRFTLSDGTASATADVTVTSDTIYVTNATDTATIDPSNGVSLSEAIAIAAGATGSQTIVFAPSLAGQTLTLAGNVALNESLTLDLSAASGVTLSGSTLTVGAGATLTVVNGAGNTATIDTALAGTGALVKSGAGALTLSGSNNSHTGSVDVNAGTLNASGGAAIGDTSAVTVNSGGTLGGSGSIGGNVTISNGATLSPGGGAGTGVLTINGNLSMQAGSTLAAQINGTTAGTGYDQVVVNGAADVTGATLSVTHGYVPGPGDSYVLIANDAADAVTGTFSGLAQAGTLAAGGNGTVLRASYAGGDGNDFTLRAPVNDAPVATTSGGTTVFTEGANVTSTPVVVDSGITLADADNATLASATVAITGNFRSGEDLLAFSNDSSTMGNVAASYDAATGVLTLTSAGASATLAEWQAALRAVTYTNTSDTPDTANRTLTLVVNDGSTNSVAVTKTISVTAVNDAPSLTDAGGTLAFTEGDAATMIDSTLTLSDADDSNLASATVTISTGYVSSEDVLAFTAQNGISGSWNSSTGVLTLSGSATKAHYEAALESVTYQNTNTDNPNTGNRTVTWVVNDGSASSTGVSSTITVAAGNDAPTDIAITNASVNQSGGANVTVGTLSTTDTDTGDTFTYSLVAGTGDTDNASFNLSGSSLRANNAANLAAGSYLVRVQTKDSANATYEEALTITVVDDVAPTFSSATPADDATNIAVNASPALVFSENIAFGTGNITLYNVTDSTTVETFDVTTAQGSGDGKVAISGKTLTLNPTDALFAGKQYAIQIDATALKDSANNAFAGIADNTTYNFTAASNAAPVITSNGGNDAAAISIPENTTAVTTVTATDADSNTLTYSILAPEGLISGRTLAAIPQNDDAQKFQIDPHSGALRFISAPDFESPQDQGDTVGNNTYVVTVKVSDGKGGTDYQRLTVTVTDVAEGGGEPPPPPPPADNDDDGVSAEEEDSIPGIPPQDGGPAVAGDGNGDGIKDSEQSQVTSLNFRQTSSVSNQPGAPKTPVTLVVGSQNGQVGSNAGNVQITSIGQQDAPDDLPEGFNAPLGLLSFTATVATQGSTGSFSFYLDGALGINGYFKQNTSGAWVNLADPANGGRVVNENGKTRLDFVIEDGGQFDSDGAADGTITDPGAPGYLPLPPDASNSAPVITSGSTASVAENAPTSTAIYQASATDADAGQSLTYSLSGTDAALLNIDSNSGAVTLKASADYEAQASYRFSVTATDNAAAPLSATQAVTVSVTDVNEAPSAVALSRSSTSLAENTRIASRREVASLNITDDALGSNTVTLSGKDAGSFEVSVGKLYLQAGTVLDFETQSRYDVSVSVADSTVAGSSPVRTDFTLRVTDVNEEGPPSADSDNDQFPDALEAAHGLSVGTKDNDVFASTKFYAMQLYRDTLFREAEGEGLAYWQQVLDSGAQSRVQVAQAFLDSPEFQTHAGALARLYFAAFERIPDEAGMNHWMEQMLSQGQSLEQVAQGFADSSEFQNQYGSLDNVGFLDTLYQNVLGRSPDEAGKAYWLEQLGAGTTRGEALAGFAQSQEYQELMREEVSVTLLYVGLLGRTPEPGGYAHWLDAIDSRQGDALGAIEAFVQSQEYHDRFLPAEEVSTAALVGLPSNATGTALLNDGIG
ncbi:DUF4347 domain-containing protein [Simplicispira metamorpha]|uniref:Uncharacterized protein DUF4214 n=1 Tax=Simplicispira metamorpha TaxID=80881 RepID=A0A4R2MWV2_9BURK|nr:DUF4347 domain-containing protein [Simplicispira metamorpha]TCP10971.1 uncharacterized protein DUF4214 [Simplicispira metamorpha]